MKHFYLNAVCMLIIGTQCCLAEPVVKSVPEIVQQQLDQCILPVTLTVKWQTKGKPYAPKYKRLGVAVSPSGTLMVNGDCRPSVAYDRIDDRTKTAITSVITVTLADGHTVPYQLKAYDTSNRFSIIVPSQPIDAVPYVDISRSYTIPLGLSVYSAYQIAATTHFVPVKRTVMSVPGKQPRPISFKPEWMLFSTQTGQFLGWTTNGLQDNILIRELDNAICEFIHENAGIQIEPSEVIHKPVDQAYQRVYNANKDSMGKLRLRIDDTYYVNTTFYALTASGEILVGLSDNMIAPASRANAEPAIATLPDGSKCLMRWRKIDKVNHLAILSPVAPLKLPLVPIIWRSGSLPGIGDPVYECHPTALNSETNIGYDPVHPDSIVLSGTAPFMLFDSQGHATALLNSTYRSIYIYVYLGAKTTVGIIRGLMPAIVLSLDRVVSQTDAAPVVTRLPRYTRNWAFMQPALQPAAGQTCTAICIDASGYFVTPSSDYFGDASVPHLVKEPSAQEIRNAYQQTNDDSYLVDDFGMIGKIVTIYKSEKLGFSIGKTRKPPLRTMKAIDLPKCSPAIVGEPLYSIDVSPWSGRLMHLYLFHSLWESADSPFTGIIDPKGDQGGMCYSQDGQPRGYITTVATPDNLRRTMLVDLAEIAKALAIVKSAMGD